MKTAKSLRITSKQKAKNKLDVRFETSPSEQAAKFIQDNAQYPMKKVGTDEVGFAVYQIDLSK